MTRARAWQGALALAVSEVLRHTETDPRAVRRIRASFTGMVPLPSRITVRVIDATGRAIFEHPVEQGDIWRMCRTRDLPIKDWVKLAVTRARATGHAAIFWLDEKRAYDRNVIEKVKRYLQDHDITGIDVQIMAPVDAISATLRRVRAGLDTISFA